MLSKLKRFHFRIRLITYRPIATDEGNNESQILVYDGCISIPEGDGRNRRWLVLSLFIEIIMFIVSILAAFL